MRVICSILLFAVPVFSNAENPSGDVKPVKALVDGRLHEPVRELVLEFQRARGRRVEASFIAVEKLRQRMDKDRPDIGIWISEAHHRRDEMGKALDARVICRQASPPAPVLAACLSENPGAKAFYDFLDDAVAQAVWGKWDFRVAMETDAEAYNRFVEEKLRATYPLTAMRMLGECGIRRGICIDVGSGGGQLDIELAKLSQLKIIGLDIDPEMVDIARKNVRSAGLEGRISFVVGDVHKMPFADNFADMIVSRGALPFFDDKKKALLEVYRVLKPSGVAFLGGRYLYTPRRYVIGTEDLRTIVRKTGIPNAEVIEARGQWVKIRGREAPRQGQFVGGMPMVARRVVVDYGIRAGKCLVIGRAFTGLEMELAKVSELDTTAMYPSEQAVEGGSAKVNESGLSQRIGFSVGEPETMTFAEETFDLVVSVGALPFWKDKEEALRQIYRVLRPGGAALLGGRYLYMPPGRRISSDALRQTARQTGIAKIRVIDDMGQWVEIRK